MSSTIKKINFNGTEYNIGGSSDGYNNSVDNANFMICQREPYDGILKPGIDIYSDSALTNRIGISDKVLIIRGFLNNRYVSCYYLDNYSTTYYAHFSNYANRLKNYFVSENNFTVDRWRLLGSGRSVCKTFLNQEGLYFHSWGSGEILAQYIDIDTTHQELINPYGESSQPITLSFKVDFHQDPPDFMINVRICNENLSNIIINKSIYSDELNSDGIYSITTTIPNNSRGIIIAFCPDSAIDMTLRWVKVERGTSATPYYPPNHTLEQLKCFAYYWDSNPYYLNPDINNYLSISAGRWGKIFFPVVMRVAPTVYWWAEKDGGESDYANIEAQSRNYISIQAPPDSFLDIQELTADAEFYF